MVLPELQTPTACPGHKSINRIKQLNCLKKQQIDQLNELQVLQCLPASKDNRSIRVECIFVGGAFCWVSFFPSFFQVPYLTKHYQVALFYFSPPSLIWNSIPQKQYCLLITYIIKIRAISVNFHFSLYYF